MITSFAPLLKSLFIHIIHYSVWCLHCTRTTEEVAFGIVMWTHTFSRVVLKNACSQHRDRQYKCMIIRMREFVVVGSNTI